MTEWNMYYAQNFNEIILKMGGMSIMPCLALNYAMCFQKQNWE